MDRGAKDYPIPESLSKVGITQDQYGKWLDKVTTPHLKRDRIRLKDKTIERKVYRLAIHNAVVTSKGLDYYTGEPLDWKLLNHFSTSKTTSTKGTKRVKQEQTPTVDHENLSATKPIFRICSMRTNKCKSDFDINTLIDFAEKLLKHQKPNG